MHRNADDLHLVMIFLMVASVVVILPLDAPFLRVLLSLPLALLLPGYALTSAMFPSAALGIPERLVATIGLSLASLVLAGLLLNYAPEGLRTNTWVILIYGVTLCATIIAVMRRSRVKDAAGGVPVPLFALREGLLLITAFVITLLALVVSYNGVVHQPEPGFTQLWILPGDAHIIQLGIHNDEQRSMEYRLEIVLRSKVIAAWSTIRLQDGQIWTKTFEIPSTNMQAQKVDAYLYTTDHPNTIYRRVELWLTASE